MTDLFPGGGDVSRATFWTGLRPMTPDGPPVIGPTRYSNLYLNTGHGTLGWTMAAGSGRVLADLISGRRPEIDLAGLTLDALRGLIAPGALRVSPFGRFAFARSALLLEEIQHVASGAWDRPTSSAFLRIGRRRHGDAADAVGFAADDGCRCRLFALASHDSR